MSAVSRHYVVFCPTTPCDGAFNFSNFLQGRVDMVARSISNALFLSRGMRQDAAITVILQGAAKGSKDNDIMTQVTWTGCNLQGLWPDDKSIASKLQRAICNTYGWPEGAGKPAEAQTGVKRKAEGTGEQIPGIEVSRMPLAEFLKASLLKATGGKERPPTSKKSRWPGLCPMYMHETGDHVREFFGAMSTSKPKTKFLVVIGGPTGLSPEEENTVTDLGFERVSFGSPSLFASHCIVLVNHYIDTWCNDNGIPLQTEPEGKPEQTSNPWRKNRNQVYN